MTTYLLRWFDDGTLEEEEHPDEPTALVRVVELYEAGIKAELFEKLPVLLKAKARIVKRKSPAPEVAATPLPAAPPEAGESVCAAPGCADPVVEGHFCRAHFVGGVSTETAAKLRKSKGEPRAAALKDAP